MSQANYRFKLPPLANHFQTHPPLTSALELLAMPPDQFVETRDFIDVLGAALWKLAVMWDEQMANRLVKQHDDDLKSTGVKKDDKTHDKENREGGEEKAHAKQAGKHDLDDLDAMEKDGKTTKLHVIHWLYKNRGPVVDSLTRKIEPPLPSYYANKCFEQIDGMMQELLIKTIPPEVKVVDGKTTKGKDQDAKGDKVEKGE